MKTRMYVKLVSSELAQLIRKTIEYAVQKYWSVNIYLEKIVLSAIKENFI